jgi:hypothetical protein
MALNVVPPFLSAILRTPPLEEDFMSRSFVYLRRALFGVSCAVVFGFGASQALAAPRQALTDGTCVKGDPGAIAYCRSYCQSQGYRDGTCTRIGFCGCL